MEQSLAYELLSEIKKTNKRLFVMSIIEMVVIVSMIIGFIAYESQFEYVSDVSQTQEVYDSSNIVQSIEGD